MKKLALVIATTAATMSLSTQAMTEQYMEQTLQQICAYAAADDKAKMNRVLKMHNLSHKTAVKKIVCNGQPLADFAELNSAYTVSNYLAKRTKPTGSANSAVAE